MEEAARIDKAKGGTAPRVELVDLLAEKIKKINLLFFILSNYCYQLILFYKTTT